jgi:hypothetical protein
MTSRDKAIAAAVVVALLVLRSRFSPLPDKPTEAEFDAASPEQKRDWLKRTLPKLLETPPGLEYVIGGAALSKLGFRKLIEWMALKGYRF